MWSFVRNMKLGWIEKKRINYKPSIHNSQFSSHCNYAGIKQIDYLVGFESLTRLQLDNNNLTTIEKLDHLITLTELGTTTMSGAL
jgi:Leucine-rich repeat (LRR) protein